jgi:mannose-6-phosphate isomerase-like protein (cupin superfamily)
MVKVISLKDARAMNLPGRNSREIISAEKGSENMTFRLVEIAPAAPGERRRGPHVHYGFEECIHVLEGQGVTRCETGEFPVSAGDTVLVPAGERHATYNTGSGTLKLMCFFPVSDIRPETREFKSWSESGDDGDA